VDIDDATILELLGASYPPPPRIRKDKDNEYR
jgi:hypothetical protein